MKILEGFKNIVDKYEFFVFDIWGVIHDGAHLYPNVIETLQYLKSQQRKISFLSNAPRRAFRVEKILNQFGITADLYDFVLTSGECTYLYLQQNQQLKFANFKSKYLYIGPDKDLDLLEGLDYQKVSDPAQADFVLTTGFDHDNSQLSEKLPLAIQAHNFKLPMICVNPDLIVVRQNGAEMICAGALALEYQKMGGVVHYFGKPYANVYDILMAKYLLSDRKKFVAIGDGIETDIKGACDFGIDSILVSSGIMSKELKVNFGVDVDLDSVSEVFNKYKIYPQYIISNLKI